MIIDLPRFLAQERPCWEELSGLLDRLERDAGLRLTLAEINRLQYLYERTSADLAAVSELVSEREIRAGLESLVVRAYGQIHAAHRTSEAFTPWRWFTVVFPQTFRRHRRCFLLAVSALLAGAVFGGLAFLTDPAEAKPALIPFGALQGHPAERVAMEEKEAKAAQSPHDSHQSFSAMLMTHNTRVAIFSLGLGMLWGAGTLVLLFYNGVVLGVVCADYLAAGQGLFLAGWLLPHGVVEIPAFLIAGQAGLLLGGALMGRGSRKALRDRLREVRPDVLTLIGGVALLLVWAGLIESFLSQYHAPVLPYGLKILFGVVEGVLLVIFLTRSGRGKTASPVKGGVPA